MKARKLNPKIFERAIAALWKNGGGCCHHIDQYLKYNDAYGTPTPETIFFRRMFGRGHRRDHCWWTPFDTEVRVIALQLAACVARDKAL